MLLAWRFHSSKVLFALLFLLLGHHAVEFFFCRTNHGLGPGRIAFESAAFLLPLNFVALSLVRERGLGLEVIASRLGLLFVQSVFVAVICRAGERTAPALFRAGLLPAELFSWSRVPQISVLLFILALALLGTRFLLYRKPAESGLFWSLAAVWLAMQNVAITPLPLPTSRLPALFLPARSWKHPMPWPTTMN